MCLAVHIAHALLDGGVHAKAMGHEDLVHHALFRLLVIVSLALGPWPPGEVAKTPDAQGGSTAVGSAARPPPCVH